MRLTSCLVPNFQYRIFNKKMIRINYFCINDSNKLSYLIHCVRANMTACVCFRVALCYSLRFALRSTLYIDLHIISLTWLKALKSYIISNSCPSLFSILYYRTFKLRKKQKYYEVRLGAMKEQNTSSALRSLMRGWLSPTFLSVKLNQYFNLWFGTRRLEYRLSTGNQTFKYLWHVSDTKNMLEINSIFLLSLFASLSHCRCEFSSVQVWILLDNILSPHIQTQKIGINHVSEIVPNQKLTNF